jgi:SPP1 family predicted phage head-tail adaptor
MTTVFESLLNHDFAVARRRRTPDGQGGWVFDYVPVGTVRGRIRPASSQEREVAASEERQVSHVFYCLAGEDIARGDRLLVGELVVDVDAVKEPSLAGEHLEIECLERQQEESTVEVGS